MLTERNKQFLLANHDAHTRGEFSAMFGCHIGVIDRLCHIHNFSCKPVRKVYYKRRGDSSPNEPDELSEENKDFQWLTCDLEEYGITGELVIEDL